MESRLQAAILWVSEELCLKAELRTKNIMKTISQKISLTVLMLAVFSIAALAADGDLDAAFNPVLTRAGNAGAAQAIIALPDGKILIGGFFDTVNGTARNSIVRLNADGTIDTTFNVGGAGVEGGTQIVEVIKQQPDGKFLIAGRFNTYNGIARAAVARINADGSLDTTFNPGTGAATGTIFDIALQADGKIFIGGSFGTFNGAAKNRLARLNADGTVDSTFNWTITPQVGVFKIVPLADGKLYIGGGWDFINGAEWRFGLVRLNADGSTDNAFVPHENDFNRYRGSVADIYLQPDGKVVAAGILKINYLPTGNNRNIVRFNTNGTIDSTFNTGDQVPLDGAVTRILPQSNGKFVIGGYFHTFNTIAHDGIARLNADGTLDASFVTQITPGGNPAGVDALVQQADGKLLIGGFFISVNGTTRTGVARLQYASNAPNRAAICDYDGDGRTDYAVRRVVSNAFNWYVGLSGGGSTAVQWGAGGDRVLCGDFDGDRKTDFTVWRATAASPIGYFYILESATNTFRFVQFGQNGDNPNVIGDYNGDGKTEVAVYRSGAAAGEQSFFYYGNSLNNASTDFTAVPWGTNGDRPYVGDFDGDGKTDVAVQRTANSTGVQYIRQSSNNTARAFNFGIGSGSDFIVPGDYNGDGKTDIALRRAETNGRVWYMTTDFGASYATIFFGSTSAQTAVGDYDGDGKTDIAVYQNDTNGGGFNFFVQQSSNGAVAAYRWGQNLDLPIATYNQY